MHRNCHLGRAFSLLPRRRLGRMNATGRPTKSCASKGGMRAHQREVRRGTAVVKRRRGPHQRGRTVAERAVGREAGVRRIVSAIEIRLVAT